MIRTKKGVDCDHEIGMKKEWGMIRVDHWRNKWTCRTMRDVVVCLGRGFRKSIEEVS